MSIRQLVESYDWPVAPDPMLDGLEPVRPEDLEPETRLALEDLQRDQAARTDPEFKAVAVLRDPVDEGEMPR